MHVLVGNDLGQLAGTLSKGRDRCVAKLALVLVKADGKASPVSI